MKSTEWCVVFWMRAERKRADECQKCPIQKGERKVTDYSREMRVAKQMQLLQVKRRGRDDFLQGQVQGSVRWEVKRRVLDSELEEKSAEDLLLRDTAISSLEQNKRREQQDEA